MRSFVYSKFRSGLVYKGMDSSVDDESMYTCCTWMSDTGSLALGTAGGCIKITNYLGQVWNTAMNL